MPEPVRPLPPQSEPVTPDSIALFRLGERCNHSCPMCSNTGRPNLWDLPLESALDRADYLASQGFRRVVLTGGEPTIHAGFWEVVARLGQRGLVWDINSNGEAFSRPGFAARARAEGLQRGIISLHSLDEPTSRRMSGLHGDGHDRILRGIDALLETGADLMLNAVLSEGLLPQLDAYLRGVHARWGGRATVKLSFPNMVGKGGAFADIQLRYETVGPAVRAALATAAALGQPLALESVPSCVHGQPDRTNFGRRGFGESHYLDDTDGRTLYAIAFLEVVTAYYTEACRTCAAVSRCPGVPGGYVRRYGMPPVLPF